MRYFCLFLLTLAVGACDSGSPDRHGFIEGTYTLPDGTTSSFRRAASARASAYSGLGTYDVFAFGTGGVRSDSLRHVSLSFGQGGLQPRSGTFSAGALNPDLPSIGASFYIHNVPVVDADGRPDTVLVSSYFPLGTVEMRVADSVISGEFELIGRPLNSDEFSLGASVKGRFEIEYEPYRE